MEHLGCNFLKIKLFEIYLGQLLYYYHFFGGGDSKSNFSLGRRFSLSWTVCMKSSEKSQSAAQPDQRNDHRDECGAYQRADGVRHGGAHGSAQGRLRRHGHPRHLGPPQGSVSGESDHSLRHHHQESGGGIKYESMCSRAKQSVSCGSTLFPYSPFYAIPVRNLRYY